MNTLKRNSLLNVIVIGLLCAVTGSLSAQDGSLRLWKPYSPESFGGARRQNDGMYGSIDMLYWKIDGPRGLKGVADTFDVNSLDMGWSFGTKFLFGNRRGHHGWQLGGYRLPGSSSTFTSMGVSTSFDPNATIPLPYWYSSSETISGNNPIVITADDLRVLDYPVYKFMQNDSEDTLTSKTVLNDLEINYTYRPHPFHWGDMEVIAGAKYWDFKDMLTLDQYNKKEFRSWVNKPLDVDSNIEDIFDALSSADDVGEFPEVTVLRQVSSTAHNRITGPQIGVNFNRTNQRWTFGAGFRAIAGMNMRSFNYCDRTVIDIDVPESPLGAYAIGDLDYSQKATVQWHRNQTRFSPGLELNLSAKWQWTEAVGFRVGFNSTAFDNIVRGSDIKVRRTDNGDGTTTTHFSVKGDGSTVLTYGINFGAEIRR